MARKLLILLTAVLGLGSLGFGFVSARAQPVEPQAAPGRVVGYVRQDPGKTIFNPNVNDNSSCETPDRADAQRVSSPGTFDRQVHLDGCLFRGAALTNGRATFESSGVGYVLVCPDPDNDGPHTSRISDIKQRCYESSYQPSNHEFHVRLNNNTGPGIQTIRFCYDPDNNGCADETLVDRVTIRWVP